MKNRKCLLAMILKCLTKELSNEDVEMTRQRLGDGLTLAGIFNSWLASSMQ